jgi:hypothetical protein
MAKTKTEKPKALDIIEVRRTRRYIRIHYKKGDEDFKIRSNENPLPSFSKALDALTPLVCTICEVPSNWDTNLRIMGLSVGDLRDVKTASIHVQKQLTLSGKVLELATPPALMSTPKTEGAVTEPLKTAHAELVAEVIEEAKRYVKGERAHGVMDLGEGEDDDEEDEDGDTTDTTAPLPFPAGSTGKPAKKRGVIGGKAAAK